MWNDQAVHATVRGPQPAGHGKYPRCAVFLECSLTVKETIRTVNSVHQNWQPGSLLSDPDSGASFFTPPHGMGPSTTESPLFHTTPHPPSPLKPHSGLVIDALSTTVLFGGVPPWHFLHTVLKTLVSDYSLFLFCLTPKSSFFSLGLEPFSNNVS